ncbi:hypothetical protein C3747_20g273c [Trypanosoma cruzi]|uniref:Uncharacterized protein n=2 Tax=Trypanosoma cruzi TaxID=5693 RepID=Q4DQZ1_TRYCC|nr:hypothetical protein, conserved [Trypanosoma cruzi]EAN94958.1 hypothetical protein, conserved [Trypanosoma cruzi]PWV17006.1 hypothetical protein C3747_20g273c [Trypanosoma cruzi]RNC57649.1 hypothetical protein TcCL_ESM04763 [Trypanosoma cruzi]|eukprot:XP_816809.1 hypothetical protein [Trypanosoma cruzi strain CL Brener]
MVLMSTYRNSRFVSKDFLHGPVMRFRALGEYYFQRAWNGTLNWTLPGEYRLYAVMIPFIYFYHRWHQEHKLDIDHVEKAMIMRWGGTLEEVRKLSAKDQLRVRCFTDIEKLYSAYGPKDVNVQPEGDSLPGKGLYKKAGEGHHH